MVTGDHRRQNSAPLGRRGEWVGGCDGRPTLESVLCTVNKIGLSNIKMEISLEFRDIKGHLSIRHHDDNSSQRHSHSHLLPPTHSVPGTGQEPWTNKGRLDSTHVCTAVAEKSQMSADPIMRVRTVLGCWWDHPPSTHPPTCAIILMKCARVCSEKSITIKSIKLTWSSHYVRR